MSEESFYTYESENGVAKLSLNRANKFNALSVAMVSSLAAKFDEIAADTTVRVVVLAAHGKAFCAGHDLTEMLDFLSESEGSVRDLFGNCADLMQKILALPQPVIASVNGIATAAGCQLVASCDLAVATMNSKFAVSGINVGLFCSTPMVALSRVMPPKKAFEMLVTGDFISAIDAEKYGLINKVVSEDDLEKTVMALALTIASKSPQSISFGKDAFYKQMTMTTPEAYAFATDVIIKNISLEDTQAGIKAFTRKQPVPVWKNRSPDHQN